MHRVTEDGRLVEVVVEDGRLRLRRHHELPWVEPREVYVRREADAEQLYVQLDAEAPVYWYPLGADEAAGARAGDLVDASRDRRTLFDPTGDAPVYGWVLGLVDLLRLPGRLRARRQARDVEGDPAVLAARRGPRDAARRALLADLAGVAGADVLEYPPGTP